MKTSSAKAKGRRLQNYVVEKLLGKSWNSVLIDEDIRPAIMGETGVDIKLSPLAKSVIPFDIECKNQENLNIWKAIEQAEANSGKGRIPLLIFKRNNSGVYAVIEFEKLLDLTR